MASATEALKEKVGLTKKKPTFMDLLEAMKPQIALALPRHLTPERMVRIALTCCRLNPRLLECTPESLLAAVMISSQLGLEPGVLGQSFLVPFKSKDRYHCQLIPGWMGILDLVNRSGKATAWTGVVYEGDFFDWGLGDQPFLRHKPCGDELHLTHAYAIARPTSSQWPIIEVWPIEKVWAHRNKINKVGEDHYSYKWPEQYARKIPLLQVLKYVPRSIELAAALSLDSAAETGGQTLSIKDVPAIIEGTGAFTEVSEPEPSETKAKTKAAPVGEMCNECRTIDGHTLDCKFHPANQQSDTAKSDTPKSDTAKSTTETPAEKANPFPKAEAKAEPEPAQVPPDAFKKLVKVRKVEQKKSVDGKTYYRITAFEEDGGAVTMICWHTNRGREIYDRYTEDGLAVFLVREKHDKSRPYFEVEDILSLAGKDYRDGKPIADPAPAADDEVW